MRKALAIIATIVVILGGVAYWSPALAASIAFGWAKFVGRVSFQVTLDGPSFALAASAFILFTVGVHWLGRSWRPAAWRWRTSFAVVGSVVVAFAAGICMIGATHQSTWLATGGEPVLVETETTHFPPLASTRNLAMISRRLGNYSSLYWSSPPRPYGKDVWEPSDKNVWERHGWGIQAAAGDLYQMGDDGGQVDFNRPWNHPVNRRYFGGAIPFLVNPALATAPLRSAEGDGLAHYTMNWRAMKKGVALRPDEMTDGAAATLLIGEVNANFRPWGDPLNVRDPDRGINRSPHGFGGPLAAGGALFAMGDGSVRFVSERISPDVLRALATPNGGEVIDDGALQRDTRLQKP